MKSFTGINKISRNMIKKTLQIIHGNRGQGSAPRSKDLKQKELPALIPLDQFEKYWRIDHYTWYNNENNDQIHQFDKPISSI